MKRHLIKFITLPTLVFTLSSCGLISDVITGVTKPVTSETSSTYIPDPVEEGDGYYKPSKMEYKATDYDSSFSPSSGDIKMLIIPIQFKTSTYTPVFTTSQLNTIKTRYFGSASNSLKSYYTNASLGSLNLSGEIANVYETNLSASTVNEYDDEQFGSFLTGAYNWTLQNNPSLNFADFDSNNDGLADSVHFITNLSESAFDRYISDEGNLWPHMWYLNNKPGTHTKPNIDVYLCTLYGMIGDTTSIHEQGHVFGVDDYYNYTSSSNADYIGGADMQDLNCFDWNSYSKLLMNWVQPYVVDGSKDSVTLNIRPTATSGDCILIPANHSHWNGSAYDEYILIELFTKSGNNVSDWDNWPNIARQYGSKGAGSLGNGGIRMYHVDSRLYGFNSFSKTGAVSGGEYIKNPKTTTYKYVSLVHTNSANHSDYSTYTLASASNNKLLTLIQAGKINTFKTGSTRNALTKGDLFQTGDVFAMNEYSSFFNNAKFNNGDSFPYTITFNSVTSSGATITISK